MPDTYKKAPRGFHAAVTPVEMAEIRRLLAHNLRQIEIAKRINRSPFAVNKAVKTIRKEVAPQFFDVEAFAENYPF